MGTCPQEIQAASIVGEVEISDAALGAFSRLRAILGERLRTHPARDGGLICEDQRTTRPSLWRISPDGTVLPDSRYSFTLRAFTQVALPQGV
jgi:hypothetical protein